MPVIRPISDLRNDFTSISRTVHEDHEPVFLTRNGVGDMVVMSMERYEAQLARLELYDKLEQARAEIHAGAKGKDAKALISELLGA